MLSETSLNINDIDRLKKINFDILFQDRIQHNQYVLLINQYKGQTIDNFAFQKFSLKELEKCNDIEFLKGNGVIIGSDINIIRIHDKNRINPQYLSLVLSYLLKSELAKYARGANILHLNNTDIKKINIPIPSLEEQENIVKLYQTKEQEIEDFKNKIIRNGYEK